MQTVPYSVSRQAIQAIVKSSARGALLTTHSMAEAEAVCDRVAVMVSGRLRWVPGWRADPSPASAGAESPGGVSCLSTLLSLPWTRCIGSVQHLKSKFGKDYLLEVKVKALTLVEPLHTEILKLFPQAARQER